MACRSPPAPDLAAPGQSTATESLGAASGCFGLIEHGPLTVELEEGCSDLNSIVLWVAELEEVTSATGVESAQAA